MKSLLAGLLLLGFVSSAQSAIVTHGDLTTDDSTNFITDTVTGRLYSRFDAFDFTYTETLAAIASGSGSEWEGWSIATSDISDDFIASALGAFGTPCDVAGAYSQVCGTISGWSDGDYGASSNLGDDFYAYLSDVQRYGPVGLANVRGNGLVLDYEGWGSVSSFENTTAINFLLYFDKHISVPETSSVYLFAFGLLGLFGVARRRV